MHRESGGQGIAALRPFFMLLLASITLLAIAGTGTGCATHRIDWAARVGSYTYDDAVRELGPPEKSAKLTDGSTVADWLTSSGTGSATLYRGGQYHGARYGGYGGPVYVVRDQGSPPRFLRLTFDPQGKLASWQKM